MCGVERLRSEVEGLTARAIVILYAVFLRRHRVPIKHHLTPSPPLHPLHSAPLHPAPHMAGAMGRGRAGVGAGPGVGIIYKVLGQPEYRPRVPKLQLHLHGAEDNQSAGDSDTDEIDKIR